MDDSSSYWKQNLKVACWEISDGNEFYLVMPVYISVRGRIGCRPGLVEYYAGLAASTNVLAQFRWHRFGGVWPTVMGASPMVQATFVMIFTMGGMAFVPNVFWLLVLRVLNGVFTGYIPNATALIASQVPKDKTGYALGTLSTGAVAGNLIGPT